MSSVERLTPSLRGAVEPPLSTLRGRRYGEDRLYLLVRDPRSVLAIWELTPDLHARARTIARDRNAPLRYQIRIERREGARAPSVLSATADLPDALGGERWYLGLKPGAGECRALLGLVLPGAFETLLHSAWVPVPPDGPCAEEGAWDLTPEARAWLLERWRAGVAPGAGSSSAARYLAPPPEKTRP